jgi:hypothetical protein
MANLSGQTTITVTLDNGQTNNNRFVKTFVVNVVGHAPTLNAITNIVVSGSTKSRTVDLSGIGLGTGKQLSIVAVSSNPGLIPNPTVNYTSPNSTGSLTITPTNLNGNATITVTANNGQAKDNIVIRQFTISVIAVVNPGAAVDSTNSINGAKAAAALILPVHAEGQFTFTVSGAPGYQYIVQASTDLVNWTSMETNTAPFDFVDKNASRFNQRFYRTVYVSP